MSLSEHDVVAQVGRISVRRLRLWVRRGWVAPSMGSEGPVFDALDVARVTLLCQLKDDCGLSDDALPLVLSLMDQLYGTRRELKLLLDAVDRLPEDMRQAVHRVHRRR
ncbi:chaperone modulator CbpM [Thalassobaculum sp. OXR-137]|uniref:chaperone modulator CbpM n=1 Tax=Thalassobaculum sp. OXR-137 TaxID=3100173 RepID=UPI002AC97808|nr:chaperone modulator CbpM [Thalassobaculum sp. OXR-137]WPZ32380.1 chaperone modulator CbpM [Thalassobaculum sp. OXR-137]